MSNLPELKADLAYMKSLAVEGQNLPLSGGIVLFLAGLIFGTAALVHYALIETATFLPLAIWGVWGGALLIFAVASVVGMSGRATSGVKNRVTGSVWRAVGTAVLIMIAVLALAMYRLDTSIFTVIIAPLVLILYGVAWWVVASLVALREFVGVAIGCFVGALQLAWFSGSAEQILIYALSLWLLVALPGWLMMRREGRQG